jgi:hypothetical protein
VDCELKSLILDLTTECHSALALNQTELEYDVGP